MKLCVLALDYDNTIARDVVLDADVWFALQEARRNGIKVIIVTGRILSELRRVAGSLDWADAVVAENGAVLALPASGRTVLLGQPPQPQLLADLRSHSLDAAAVLGRQGCALSQWQQLRLWRPLSTPIPVPPLPAGFTLQDGVRAVDLEQYSALHRDIGLGGAETPDEHLARRSSPAYRPDLDLITLAPSGELAALCLGFLEAERVGPHGEREGWVDLVGTRHEYRRLGLARALLLVLLERLQAYGLDTAWLTVDGANTAALRLFATVGFHCAYTVRWHSQEIGG